MPVETGTPRGLTWEIGEAQAGAVDRALREQGIVVPPPANGEPPGATAAPDPNSEPDRPPLMKGPNGNLDSRSPGEAVASAEQLINQGGRANDAGPRGGTRTENQDIDGGNTIPRGYWEAMGGKAPERDNWEPKLNAPAAGAETQADTSGPAAKTKRPEAEQGEGQEFDEFAKRIADRIIAFLKQQQGFGHLVASGRNQTGPLPSETTPPAGESATGGGAVPQAEVTAAKFEALKPPPSNELSPAAPEAGPTENPYAAALAALQECARYGQAEAGNAVGQNQQRRVGFLEKMRTFLSRLLGRSEPNMPDQTGQAERTMESVLKQFDELNARIGAALPKIQAQIFEALLRAIDAAEEKRGVYESIRAEVFKRAGELLKARSGAANLAAMIRVERERNAYLDNLLKEIGELESQQNKLLQWAKEARDNYRRAIETVLNAAGQLAGQEVAAITNEFKRRLHELVGEMNQEGEVAARVASAVAGGNVRQAFNQAWQQPDNQPTQAAA